MINNDNRADPPRRLSLGAANDSIAFVFTSSRASPVATRPGPSCSSPPNPSPRSALTPEQLTRHSKGATDIRVSVAAAKTPRGFVPLKEHPHDVPRLCTPPITPFEERDGQDNPFFPPIVVLKGTPATHPRRDAVPFPEKVVSSSSWTPNSLSNPKNSASDSDRPSLAPFRSSESTLVDPADRQIGSSKGSPAPSSKPLGPSYPASPFGFPDRRGRKELSLTELFTPPIPTHPSTNTRHRSHKEQRERGDGHKDRAAKQSKAKPSGKEDKARGGGREDKTKDHEKKRKTHRKAAYSSSSASDDEGKKLDAEKAIAKQSWSKHSSLPAVNSATQVTKYQAG
ncbi:hypothetical protein PUNSTDRAFT_142668 [Punctularia strigosozonata HHB-11173 SS5]|uniref:uncharacterized protein n=1 Tax=Punctularia strigosozonata (strain HHB-11173) TaxID=741275 RepID=UPI00044178FE|nr:uncharacterized protein PUNSTDRAFT_142668 [Punctularia strigosozonata HHB-11173 SS5]EIN10715.1 hypothetical protein PUNSTDRAFT_142668 [Punctularia strigosozonata HHB-11173 SS5]